MDFDAHKNFAYSQVYEAPSPQLNGTSLTVLAGEGSRFPAAPFNAVAFPLGQQPTPQNAEIVRVTARDGDVLTIVRAQENTTAKAIDVNWHIAAGLSQKTIEDLETAMNGALDDIETLNSAVEAIETDLTDVVKESDTQTLTNKTLSTGSVIDADVIVTEVMKKMLPVGSIYMNETDSRNPNAIFGFGTWVSYAPGQVIVGLDAGQTEFNSAGKTGGEKTHILTAGEIAKHPHPASSSATSTVTDPGHDHELQFRSNGPDTSGASWYSVPQEALDSLTGPRATGITVSTSVSTTVSEQDSGDGSHNNLQPYITAYIWKRTA